MFLLLDWAKAFDRIRVDALLQSLSRFGLPAQMLEMIRAIYTLRIFDVRESGCTSTTRLQASGIAQGCPLSPYLFIIAQTVLLWDVDHAMAREGFDVPEPEHVVTNDVLYADDTLLISASEQRLQRHLELIVAEGKAYGMELNWDKTVVMQIRHHGEIKNQDGVILKCVSQAIYLGGLLTSDGSAISELARRLGEAGRCFEQLQSVWKHANISRLRKLQIYNACVVAKVLYALDSLWLLKADRRRLDAFHCKCLRRICGIKHSWISHVTNQTVLDTAGAVPLSQHVIQQQLGLFRRLSQLSVDSYPRQLVFEDNTLLPKKWPQLRPQGRPKQQWADNMFRVSLVLTSGSQPELVRLFADTQQAAAEWQHAVKSHNFGHNFL
ncbi:unnamed protein product [Polarella glacialis]|uniref:Reverse transcriptase domain-containing protein n=1 Tax=Polarella glacialis TaxID=89957 RepID=A0A813G3C1_POLGL|nr:unnamed protein product [Polarella glacialis]